MQYGDRNLEEIGSEPVSKEAIATGIEKLNKAIEATTEIRKKRKAVSLKKQIVEQQEKISKYEEQLEIAQQRSGYSKTDYDASVMKMKNEEFLPAYNVVASSENQFITAITTHQNSNDAACFKEHLESFLFKPNFLWPTAFLGLKKITSYWKE